jgi:hypothetical protein
MTSSFIIGFICGLLYKPLVGIVKVMFGDRSGNSGRSEHWLENKRIIGKDEE